MSRNAVVIVFAFLAIFATVALATLPDCCLPGATSQCQTPGTCCQNATGLMNCTYLNGLLVGTSNYPPENIDLDFKVFTPSLTTTWQDLGPACVNAALQYLCNSSAYGDGNANLGCSLAPPPPNSSVCAAMFQTCGLNTIYLNFFGISETFTMKQLCFGMASGMQQPLSAFVLAALMVVTYLVSQQQ